MSSRALVLAALALAGAPLAIARAGDDPAKYDAVVGDLDKDYNSLYDESTERQKTRLREVERAFDGAPGGGTAGRGRFDQNAVQALRTLRKLRAKAGVPMILKAMLQHAGQNDANFVQEGARTITLLTGKVVSIEQQWGQPSQPIVAALAEDWWKKDKEKITTDLSKLTRDQLGGIVSLLLGFAEQDSRNTANRMGYNRFNRGNGEDTSPADTLRAVFSAIGPNATEIMGQGSILESDLSANMEPILLDYADDTQFRFATVTLLGILRQQGEAKDLEEILADPKRPVEVRLVADLALLRAGEHLVADPLPAMLKEAKKLDLRLAVIFTLGRCKKASVVLPVLLEQLADPNREVRAAAIYAIGGLKLKTVPPELKKLTESNDWDEENPALLETLGSFGVSIEARDMLGSIIKRMTEQVLNQETTQKAMHVLQIFQSATGKNFMERAGNRPDQVDKALKEALAWWEKAKNRKPGADGDKPEDE